MNLRELYEQTPVERHPEIIVSGDRLFFDNEEYLITGDGELRLIRSQKGVEEQLADIDAKLAVS